MSDKDLLDWLDEAGVEENYGGWQLRRSSTGRGWRLLTTTAEPNFRSVRTAIEHGVAQERCGEL